MASFGRFFLCACAATHLSHFGGRPHFIFTKIIKMSFGHRFFSWLQWSVLLVFIAVGWFYNQDVLLLKILTGIFFISEIILLEFQRKIKPEEIRYRKSGWFALLDLLSIVAFLIYAVLFIVFKERQTYPPFFYGILAYTLIRKIYIYKNFTYEK